MEQSDQLRIVAGVLDQLEIRYFVTGSVAGMLKISGESVDRSYITSWATRLGLESIWKAMDSGNRPG